MTPPASVWSASDGPNVAGAGPSVVLIHGTLDRSAGMLKLSRRLADRFEVIRYDRRGYGRSSEVGPPYTIADNVDDLFSVVDAHTDAPVTLFGHSYGGNVALAAAERRPDRVSGVVTYESPMSWLPNWQGAAADRSGWDDDPAGAAESFLRRLLGDRVWERLPESTRAQRRMEGATMIAEIGELSSRPPWRADRITVPVVAVAGTLSSSRHRDAMRALGEQIVSARVVDVDGARHFGPSTHPDAVAAIVAEMTDQATSQTRSPRD